MEYSDNDSLSESDETSQTENQSEDVQISLGKLSDVLIEMKMYLEENGLTMLDRKKTLENLIIFVEDLNI